MRLAERNWGEQRGSFSIQWWLDIPSIPPKSSKRRYDHSCTSFPDYTHGKQGREYWLSQKTDLGIGLLVENAPLTFNNTFRNTRRKYLHETLLRDGPVSFTTRSIRCSRSHCSTAASWGSFMIAVVLRMSKTLNEEAHQRVNMVMMCERMVISPWRYQKSRKYFLLPLLYSPKLINCAQDYTRLMMMIMMMKSILMSPTILPTISLLFSFVSFPLLVYPSTYSTCWCLTLGSSTLPFLFGQSKAEFTQVIHLFNYCVLLPFILKASSNNECLYVHVLYIYSWPSV